MRRRTCLGIMLAVVAAPRAAFPEPPFAQPEGDAFDGVAQQIERIESSHGVYSPDLIAPLTNLGLLLREQGDVRLAVAAFERARHLVRVNHGLSSFEEAPLLRQLMQIEQGNGNAAAAWDLEQDLLALIYRHPGPRAAPMLREIADKRTDVLGRYSAGEMPPEIMLGCYYEAPGTTGTCPRSGSRVRVKTALQNEAWSYYADTIAMAGTSTGSDGAAIPEIYLALVRILYAFPDSDVTEDLGRQILGDLYLRTLESSAPLQAQLDALIRLADWSLLFAAGRDKKETAFNAYKALYDQLEELGFDGPSIDAIFSPSTPVVLPAFLPSPLASAETPDSSGYIDVAFDITKYGESKAIEILDTSTSTASAARARLLNLVDHNRFRPQVAGGAFKDRARVVVRYYVND